MLRMSNKKCNYCGHKFNKFKYSLTLRFTYSRIHLVSAKKRFGTERFSGQLLQFLDSNVIEQNLTLLTGMDLQGKEAL